MRLKAWLRQAENLREGCRDSEQKDGKNGATDGRRQSERGALFLLYFNMEFLQDALMDGMIQSRGNDVGDAESVSLATACSLGCPAVICVRRTHRHFMLGLAKAVPFSLIFFVVVILLLSYKDSLPLF